MEYRRLIRKTEDYFVVNLRQNTEGHTRIKTEKFQSNFLIVYNRKKTFEQALFITRQDLFSYPSISVVCPLTSELHVFPESDSFVLAWGDSKTEICEISVEDPIIRYIITHCNEYSKYQTVPFNLNSPKLKWVWYYREHVPSVIQSSNSTCFFPEHLFFDHYGKPIMNAWVDEITARKKELYINELPFSLLVVTWNVAGSPPDGDIQDCLKGTSDKNSRPVNCPDFIVVGLQEICFLGKVWGDSDREVEWMGYISSQVKNVYGDYYKIIFQESLVGILSIVFVKVEHVRFIKNVFSRTLKLGLKGYTGNKGAVGIRFEIYSTSICVVNVHLVHNTDKFEERNKNISDIFKGLRFIIEDSEICIDEHDFIFLIGDFNYRIDLPSSKIRNIVLLNELKLGLKFDQLNKAKQNYSVLSDYKEGEISFPPTFKLNINGKGYNFKRDPAWCDRVLYKGNLYQERYDSCSSVMISDHRPVFSLFNFSVEDVNDEKKAAVLAEILQEIDQNHQRLMPKIKVFSDKIEFGSVKYKIAQKKKIKVKNVGFSFANFQVLSEAWAKCDPSSYVLPVGEEKEVEVSILVDFPLLKAFRSTNGNIQKMIRISVEGGSEFIIELVFEISDTLIGRACQVLNETYPSEVENVPMVLVFILEKLEKVIYIQEVFEPQNEIEELGHYIAKFDSKELSQNLSLFHVLQVFWELVKKIEGGLVDGKIIDAYSQVIKNESMASVKEKVLSELNPVNRDSFLYVVSFFIKLKLRFQLSSEYVANHFYKVFYQNDSISEEKKSTRVLLIERLLTHLNDI